MTPRGLGGLALDRKKTSKKDKKVEDSKPSLESHGSATCQEDEVKKERPSSAEEAGGNRKTAWKATQKATQAGRGGSGTQDVSINMLNSIQSFHKVLGRGYPGGAPDRPFSEDPSWLSMYLIAYRSSLDAAIPVLVMLILMTLVFLGSPLLALMMFPVFFLTGVFVLARIWNVFPNQLLGSRYLLVYMMMILGMAGIHFFVEVFTWTRDYTIEQLLFIVLFGMEPYFFWKSVTTDPGTVKSEDDKSLHGTVQVGNRQTCTTCKTNRPLRSKHCGFCGSCVRRFDHHCPLIYNCVGEGNQAYFLAFLTIGFAGQLIYLHLCLITWLREVGYTVKPTWLLTIADLVPAFQAARAKHSMSVFWSVFHLLACPVLGLLWIRQVTCAIANITTNEMANWHRYDYLQDKQGSFQNIFDAGVLGNVTDFFSASIDWDQQMSQAQDSMHRWSSKFPSTLVQRLWLSRRPRSSSASCVRCVDDPKV